MHMVWHDDEFAGIDGNARTQVRRSQPFLGNDSPGLIQTHFPVDDLPEQTRAVLGTYRHEIRTRGRVVVLSKTDGSSVMAPRIECHVACPTKRSTLGTVTAPDRSLSSSPSRILARLK